jgi:hypothetical protein
VGSTEVLGTIRYPGPPITVRFLETDRVVEGQVCPELRYQGAWSALHLLAQAARRDETDPHKWFVELSVTDPKEKPRSIWLEIVYASVIPAADDWPKWSGETASVESKP